MPGEHPWDDWVLLALADHGPAPSGVSLLEVRREVAVHFADRFSAQDRVHHGLLPDWQLHVRDALDELEGRGLVRGADPVSLTAEGSEHAERVRDAVHAAPPRPPTTSSGDATGGPVAADWRHPLLTPGVIAAPLRDRDQRRKMGFPDDDTTPMPVMVELNLRFAGGPVAALAQLTDLWRRVTGGSAPVPLADEYATGRLTMNEMKRLVAADAVSGVWPQRSVFHLWPDFPVVLQVDASAVTIKVDAARRAFNAYGSRIVWAVVDSGIDASHPHFTSYDTLTHSSVIDLHRFFPDEGEPTSDGALEDETGHGTHVAGIIAGGLGPWLAKDPTRAEKVLVTENRYNVENPMEPSRTPRVLDDPSELSGMAPKTRLVSLKAVHSGGRKEDRVGRVIAALAYVREVNGQGRAGMRIHGVNLSVGYEFNPEWFACGQSPLCQEVDKLVRSGVVVVVAAGNSGFGTLSVFADAPAKFGMDMTINDPGNAERAITVGATHREMPHTYGVSYFSSKGPTGDGRSKPDLVAPGERITSCAAGEKLAAVLAGEQCSDKAVYVEDSGTSMAAPHVSGAIAAFLSVRREFIGRPDVVKTVVVQAATNLGRQPHFQGGGLLDLMRALQSV